MKKNEIKAIRTRNFIEVERVCDAAYRMKRPLIIVGERGYGKSLALEKYKKANETAKKKIILIDVAMTGATPKKLISAILEATGNYKAGTMEKQLKMIKENLLRTETLLLLDEVSAMKGRDITVLKDIMSALRDIAGIVVAGTPYFWKNINRGTRNDQHLYGETLDRMFFIENKLYPPKEDEAIAIFKANGLTDKEIEIVSGKSDKPIYNERFDWHQKPTYRGIIDVIDLVLDARKVGIEDKDENYLKPVE